MASNTSSLYHSTSLLLSSWELLIFNQMYQFKYSQRLSLQYFNFYNLCKIALHSFGFVSLCLGLLKQGRRLYLMDLVLIQHSGLPAVNALLMCRYSSAALCLFSLKYYLTLFTWVVYLQDIPMLIENMHLFLSSYYSLNYIFPGFITNTCTGR